MRSERYGMWSWLSCKKFCESASKKLDKEQSWYELPGYYFHYVICMTCRRYLRQISLIQKALGCCTQESAEQEALLNLQPPLGEEAKARIATTLPPKSPT